MSMNVQWYPGHMTKARRAMQEQIRLIDLVIELKSWNEAQDYDRLGLAETKLDILGVQVPWQIIPVAPGRNLASVIEVSARNLSLKRMGYHSAKEFFSILQQDEEHP